MRLQNTFIYLAKWKWELNYLAGRHFDQCVVCVGWKPANSTILTKIKVMQPLREGKKTHKYIAITLYKMALLKVPCFQTNTWFKTKVWLTWKLRSHKAYGHVTWEHALSALQAVRPGRPEQPSPVLVPISAAPLRVSGVALPWKCISPNSGIIDLVPM